MKKLNRMFAYGFLTVAIAAALARWRHDDIGDKAEMFFAMLVFAGFLMWALINYIYAWVLALTRQPKITVAAGPEYYPDDARVEVLPPLHANAPTRRPPPRPSDLDLLS